MTASCGPTEHARVEISGCEVRLTLVADTVDQAENIARTIIEKLKEAAIGMVVETGKDLPDE